MATQKEFVSSLQELKNDSSQGLNGYYHVCMGSIVTGLHILTICSCVTDYDTRDQVFLIKSPGNFIAVAGTNSLSERPAERQVKNFFIHRYCGGQPRKVDLGMAKVDRPWEPIRVFGVAPLDLHVHQSYHDYKVKFRELSTYDCHVQTWINREGIEEEWKPYDENTPLEEKRVRIHPNEDCYPFNITYDNTVIPVNSTMSRIDQFCGVKVIGNSCGVDKGAPLVCEKANLIFLAGIGIGGTKCFPDAMLSRSLFQSFQEALSFMRLYLALDDTLPDPTLAR